MAVKRFKALIHGEVQGVGYRYFALDAAQLLGVKGYVRNLYSGDVEVVAEGEEGLLARFLGMLREGPSHADVSDVSIVWGESRGEFDGFSVRR